MSLQRAPSILTFSQDTSEKIIASSKQTRPFLLKFGPSDLLGLIQKYNFNFELTQYKQVFLPGTTEIDLFRSPIISKLPDRITTTTQIELLTSRSDSVDELKSRNFRNTAIEPGAQASAQCKFIYDRMPKGKPINCWLCGFPLNYDPITKGPSKRSSVECEHILPAAAALIFHGIIDEASDVSTHGSVGSEDIDREDKGDREFYELNYDLAHAECNFPKKDTLLFITLFHDDHSIVDNPQINDELVNEFINNLVQPLKNGQQTLVKDCIDELYKQTSDSELIKKWKSQRFNAIKERLKPLLANLQAGIKLWLILGVDKLLKNIDYMFAKYAIKDGIVFPMSKRLETGGGEWYPQQVKTKKDYNDFIDLAFAKQSFPHIAVGGKRKRTRRIKKNGKFSTSRRRVRTKNGNRKNTGSNRK